MSSKIVSYGLYQTLNKNIPRKDITSTQKTLILEKLNKLTIDQIEAVVMLVCEHGRVHNDFDYDPENVNLPYEGVHSKNSVTFDLKKIPIPLRWILLKFIEVINKSSLED